MQKRQKKILINFAAVITLTAISVVAMINFKDMVNRSEAIRAMEYLGQEVHAYRQRYGSVPPEYHVDTIRDSLPGFARVGQLHYRARWIGFESTGDTILAYTRKDYRSSLLGRGIVVLRLDGTVEWMKPAEFEPLLQKQQTQEELRNLQEQLKDK
jgi:hypothetical protein